VGGDHLNSIEVPMARPAGCKTSRVSASGLEERIGTLLAQRRHELAEIVDRMLEHEIALLVEERLAQRFPDEGVPSEEFASQSPGEHAAGNGNGAARRVCVSCGQDKPVTDYEKSRRMCRSCRRRSVRERAARRAEPAGAVDAEPRPVVIAVDELLHRVRGHGAVPPDLERWLVAEQFAVRVAGGLAPTGRCVELGGDIRLS
jgi:hypothetical protein